MSARTLILLAGAGLVLAACTTTPAVSSPPLQAVPMSHYSGTWLEIGRRPMWLTDGCVAGFTTYSAGADAAEVMVLDGCYRDTPSGKLKTISGKGRVLDAGGSNAILRVNYPFFQTWTFNVLFEAQDHSWFISADPKMKNLWIYARKAPSARLLAEMKAKAQSLGYDVNRLEFPTQ